MTHWLREFVGIPRVVAGRSRAGVDCYGILWLVYRDVLGIEVASYANETLDAKERAEVADLIAGGRVISPWRQVEIGTEREFDMVVFRRGGIESHIGVVVEPGRMLHVVDENGSYVETYASGRWNARLISAHRHELRA